MCRFLLARSDGGIQTQALLEQFSTMSENSRTPDGGCQEDGWGAAWINGNDQWTTFKSLQPIWENRELFSQIPSETQFLAIHARSASSPNRVGVIEYNQPYIKDSLCFVFNGGIEVRLKRKVNGEIGAQKLFTLTAEALINQEPNEALRYVHKLITSNSRTIRGLNIAIMKEGRIAALCEHNGHPYYNLHYYRNEHGAMVCSEAFGNFPWQQMNRGEVIDF